MTYVFLVFILSKVQYTIDINIKTLDINYMSLYILLLKISPDVHMPIRSLL